VGLKTSIRQAPSPSENKSATTNWSGDRPVGRNEGADRNADHVIDPLVAEAALESWPRKNRGTGLHIG
jgi:hypothetical protein